MDVKELQAMADVELQEKERQLKQEVFNLRFQLATGRPNLAYEAANFAWTGRTAARMRASSRAQRASQGPCFQA